MWPLRPRTPVAELQRRFGFAERPNLSPSQNVAPTQAAPVVRARADGTVSRPAPLRRDLVPRWSDGPGRSNNPINAHAETAAAEPAFRGALGVHPKMLAFASDAFPCGNRTERDFQELKQEIGLGRYEGRGWRGFHRHAALCIAAYGFVVAERGRSPLNGAVRPRSTPGACPAPRLPAARRRCSLSATCPAPSPRSGVG